MTLQPYYSRQSLADEVGIGIAQIDRHIRAGTCKLNQGFKKEAGIGRRIEGRHAKQFILMMKAKKISSHVAV